MFRDRVDGNGRKPPPADPDGGLTPKPYLRTGQRQDGGAGEADGQAPKKADPLPRPGDAYRAHARFLGRLNGNEPRVLHFVKADFTCEGFCYSDLRRLRWLPSPEPGQGPLLLLRFVEAEITDVEIAGRRLEDVHLWISEGAMPWLWEKPPGVQMRDDAATVITRITLRPAKGRMSGE